MGKYIYYCAEINNLVTTKQKAPRLSFYPAANLPIDPSTFTPLVFEYIGEL